MKNTRIPRSFWLALLVFALSALFIFLGNRIVSGDESAALDMPMARAKVVRVISVEQSSVDYAASAVTNELVVFTAKLQSGAQKGFTVTAFQYVDNLYPLNPPAVSAGDSVVLSYYSTSESAASGRWMFSQYNRTGPLALLVGIFLACIILLGRKKGVATVAALTLTCACIFAVFLPALLNNKNIYVITIITALFSVVSSLLLIGGFNKKTLCAIVGNASGVLLAGALAALFSVLLNVTGLLDENYLYLTYLFEDTGIDLRAVVWSGIVIGSLGAVMDVAMTIASSMNELAATMRDKSYKTLLRSGLNIGRDAIGTMTNTLILAYIGGSLATVLLLIAYNRNALYLLNLEMIVVEILQAVSGSMGILFAVPATALFAAWIFNRPEKQPTLKEGHKQKNKKADFSIGHAK